MPLSLCRWSKEWERRETRRFFTFFSLVSRLRDGEHVVRRGRPCRFSGSVAVALAFICLTALKRLLSTSITSAFVATVSSSGSTNSSSDHRAVCQRGKCCLTELLCREEHKTKRKKIREENSGNMVGAEKLLHLCKRGAAATRAWGESAGMRERPRRAQCFSPGLGR